MSYDKVDWHFASGWPEGRPEENAGTHIGMFLAWAILRDLIGDQHRENAAAELEDVRQRRITGREFLVGRCGGKFLDADLNEDGNDFADFYYRGKYFKDYNGLLANDLDSCYAVEDTWENFDKLVPTIDRRFAEWRHRAEPT